ncbi:hypothetical protein [Mucilaginibacter celer]|uniref:Uncharacterized protein n=1 Tax=Mucilaginibacter celer TaxID=2305508 RepID=A0A494VR69_9SPHI|nr:hypothetical protein [Mucilaginibacter celer]AYL93823.1 hypothetical protein HYN43_000270 [Mucilaginibacter celer]
MNKLIVTNKSILCAAALLLVFCLRASAQQTTAPPAISVGGKTYLKQTIVRSESMLQNGAAKLNINSVSSISKTCKFDNAPDNAFTATLTITRLTDSITSGDQKFYFSSAGTANSQSKLSQALASMVGKVYSYAVDKKGAITSVIKNYPPSPADSVFSFAGLEQEQLFVGKTFPFVADIATLTTLETGKRWGDTTVTAKGRAIGEYWLEKNEGPQTVLAFIKTINDGGLNTQSTGTYTIDNATGVIVGREIKNITTGYLSFKGTPYISTRRSTITETCSLAE